MKLIKLSDLKIKDRCRISWIDAKKVNPLVLIVGLVEGTQLEIISKSGVLIEIAFYGTRFVLSETDAANIMVVRS